VRGTDFRLGDWRRVLEDVEEVDAVICDPPYGDRTHRGHNEGVTGARFEGEENRTRFDRRTGTTYSVGVHRRRSIGYAHWTPDDVDDFVAAWSPRCRGWFVAMTSHDLIGVWTDALTSSGRYCFAPVTWVSPGGTVRLAGDGPANWTVYIIVARPRAAPFARWGALPGAYVMHRGQGNLVGGKPAALMRAIVRDYSRPGDLVMDPCAGYATTLRAAVIEGRRAVGAEIDPETHAEGAARLALPYTPSVQFDRLDGDQGGLFDGVGA